MEFAAVKDPRNFGAANLLGVPGMGFSLLDSDDEKCVVVMGIVPRSSPLPRRKTSEEELEEAQQQQPAHGSRRVCFADAKGLCLVLVKEFDCWDVPKLLGYDQRLAEGQDVERYSYYLSFPSPLPTPPEELGSRVREQRIELESIELLPGTTVLRGLVRVLNVSFDKTVFVRTTLDAWASHFDLLAEYVQGSSDGATDCFSFKLTLVPPFDEQGSRVDFCLRYETSVGTFWANNNAKNYVLFCHQRVKEEGEMLQEECVCRKSCLKAARQHFTTVDNSSLEENMQSTEKDMEKTGVSENGDTLNMNSRQVTDIYLVTSEDKCHTLTMESNRNASRKRRRRAARQAKLKELFPQRDNQPERENESEASLPEPPSDCAREGENLAESTLDSVTCSSADNQRQRYISRAQSGGSSQAEKSESVDPVDPVQPLGAERREVTATRARQPHLVDKVEQKQHFATCITGENRQKPLGSVRQSDRGSDNVCFVNSTGEESHGALSLAESTDAPVTAPSSFTFGTMVASLYPLACRQVKSENRNLADQLNPTRERSMMGDSLENSASISADLPGNNEDTSRISGGQFGSHDRISMNTHLSDVLKEDGKSCISVAADTSTNHAEVDCQESVHERTGRPNNPQPTTNEDMTPSDVNNELLNECATREGSHLQGGALESPQDLGLQWKKPSEQQIMADEDAGKAQTEAEDDIQMQLNLTQTLAPTQVVQETTDPASQPHLSPFMSACENQEVHQQICCDVATGFICVDKSEEQDGIQPTVSVSTTNIYPEQGREIEQLEEICAVTFKAADISVGDNSIPEFQRCSAVDVSQETLQTSLEVAAEPDNRGNESTNNLEDGDITPTIEYEDSVSECIKVNRYSSTHPYMLGEEIELALVEKPVCTPADAEHSTVEDAASKPDYFGSYAVRTEDKNWEMMVEEEEEDALGEEVMTKEVAENGGKGRDELKEEQTIAKQQALEKTIGCEKREHTETEFEGQKHVCVTEEKSKEEPFIWEEQEVEEEEVKKDADHGTDNQHDVWEDIRIEEKENLAETDRETRVPVEDKTERISVDEEESSVSGAGEGGLAVVEEIVVGTAKAERNEEMERPETRSHASQNKAESDPATPVSNVHEGEVERVIDKENSLENGTTCFPNEMHLISKEEGQNISYRLHLTNDRSKALSESPRWGNDSSAAENGSLIFTDELKCDPMAEKEQEEEEEEEEEEEDSSSSGSPSDEEMELYIHRMRAAPSPQTLRSFPRDGGSGKGSHTGKRPSIDRPRLLSSSMPPISESVNEEHLSDLDCPEEREVETFQDGSMPFPAQDNQEYEGVNTAQWTDAFSCSNIMKSLLYITMFVVFVVVAYHYDFLACFALYLLSIFWLYCRADKQPVPNNNGLN